MHVPIQVKNRIDAQVERYMKKADDHFHRMLPRPRVTYNKRGRTAGVAKVRENTIDLNAVLLMENLEDMIEQTVPHEVAHIVDYQINGIQWKRGGRRGIRQDHHGEKWKYIMRMFGLTPDRCHTYDTSNAAVRRKARFEYTCSGCGEKLEVGPTVHRKIQNGQHRWHRGCGPKTHIFYAGTQQPTPVAARTSQNTPKRRSKSGSTLDRVRKYMSENDEIMLNTPKNIRPQIIAEDLGIKKTTAATYYHKLKHEFGLW